MSSPSGLTPALQQYVDMKQHHQDCILFFRMGDFYETFFEDATICSKVLDIVLTSRNKNSENSVPMAGIPYHSSEKYIQKLINHGYKVAIAEQMSTPQAGKIVERKVTAIITPGTFLSETHTHSSNMLSIFEHQHCFHCARGDFTQGRYKTQSFSTLEDALKHLLIILPSEIILDSNFKYKQVIHNHIQHFHQPLISLYHLPPEPEKLVQQTLRVHTLASFGDALKPGKLETFALLVHYLSYTQQSHLSTITSVSTVTSDNRVLLDEVTIKNLEIYHANYDQSKKHSLLGVLDTMQTHAGSILLKEIITSPSQDISLLQKRYEHIEYYVQHQDSTHILRKHLSQFSDIQKLISILTYKKMSATGFGKLRLLLGLVCDHTQAGALLLYQEVLRLGFEENVLKKVSSFWTKLKETLKPELDSDELDYIQDGIDPNIDELRKLAYQSDELLMHYQQEIVKHTGISGIKLRFVLNQGYAVEVTNKDISALEKASKDGDPKLGFQRRQTLKGTQRYTTQYLDDLQEQILSAKEQLIVKEKEWLHQLLENLKEIIPECAQLSEGIARCDLYTGHAYQVREKKYCKPELTKQSILRIQSARHPVIEEHLEIHEQFISNTLEIGTLPGRDPSSKQGSLIHIITGPNMGGKSTYLRQNALCVLMAQCGLRVPAEKMIFHPCDGIFARVGTGDHIAKRQSTFMTEMVEVSSILHHATENSFIIFDELGRGTSTYDGMALSWSIIMYILEKIKAKTLLATHYHELIELEQQSSLIQNFSVGVYETDKELVFLKKIVAGGANKSYGIDVAALAGLPREIIEDAKHTLTEFTHHSKKSSLQEDAKIITKEKKTDADLFGDSQHSAQISDTIRRKVEKINYFLQGIDIHHCTPLQALQFLAKIKDERE